MTEVGARDVEVREIQRKIQTGMEGRTSNHDFLYDSNVLPILQSVRSPVTKASFGIAYSATTRSASIRTQRIQPNGRHSGLDTLTTASLRLAMSGSRSMPKARPGRRGDHAVLHLRQRGHQLLVPAGVERAHQFLDQRVGRVAGQVRGGGEHHRAGAVVRRHRQVLGLGHGGDLLGLRQAAAPGQVEHDDAGGAGLQQLAEGPAECQASPRRRPGRGWRRRRSLKVRQASILIGSSCQKVSNGSSAWAMRIAVGRFHIEWNSTMMSILSPTASRILSERLQRRGQVGAGDVVAAGGLRRRIERPDLHAGDALLQQRRAPARRRGAGSRRGPRRGRRCCRRPQFSTCCRRGVADVLVAGAGVVGADALAGAAAEQLGDRLVGGLAAEVPERDVDRRGCRASRRRTSGSRDSRRAWRDQVDRERRRGRGCAAPRSRAG